MQQAAWGSPAAHMQLGGCGRCQAHEVVPGKMPAGFCPHPQPARAMPLFWKPYKSEVTHFIEELKVKKSTLEEEQRAGRALLWDREQDRSALAEWHDAKVAQQAYVYQTKTGS